MILRSVRGAVLALGLAAGAAAVPAQAGVYADEVSKCLVRSMTPADQTTFIQWMFSAMALHPDVKAFANITPEQHDAFDRKSAALFERMLTVDCRKEVIDALKYEGASTLESSFSTLGQAAMRGLLSNPDVAVGMSKLNTYSDKAKMRELYKDAGLPPPAGL